MDIIIKNGKINFNEMNKEYSKKNEEGLIKKNYIDFNNSIPGPYYDLNDSHLHVWRKPQRISNFNGPQDRQIIKLTKREWNNNKSYCSICHCAEKQNTAFDKNNNFRTLYISEENNNENNNEIIKPTYICKSTNFNGWYNLFNKLTDRKILINSIKSKRNKIHNKYYQMVYKLMHKPIIYNISPFNTKLLYPWQITPYQQFKLNNPNYKNTNLFFNPHKITENFIKIEKKLQIL